MYLLRWIDLFVILHKWPNFYLMMWLNVLLLIKKYNLFKYKYAIEIKCLYVIRLMNNQGQV